MLAGKYYFVSKCQRFRSFIYVLKPKNSDYLQLTSFIINGISASLLSNIINTSYMQILVVQKDLPFGKLFWAINKSH